MQQTDWERVKSIIGEALDRTASERHVLIEARCGGDEALRTEVLSLLTASESSEALLTRGADAWVGAAAGPVRLPSGGRIGKFEIIRVIAESSAAAVYLAQQRQPERSVALKVLRTAPLLGPDPRFWLEASAAARVEHPSVVRVYEAGMLQLAEGHRAAYIAMEYVDGVPVTRAARDGGMDGWRIASLMEDIARGVGRIHQCGVIHRDLKPSNVLVDRAGQPRIVDFGIARPVANTGGTWVSLQGAVAGTPGYMSPEAISRPEEVDVRSDVWALGAIAYELLTGAAPFAKAGVALLDVMRQTVSDDVPGVRVAAPWASRDLEAVVMKALARRPSERYGSAMAFADDLRNAYQCRPVTARRPTVMYRVSRFVRRNTVSLALAGVVAFAMFALGLAQVAAWKQASHERSRAAEVVGLIRGMIASADPALGGRDARMLDVVRGLEAQLETNTQLDGLTQADVRALLGTMYFGLAEYGRSRSLLETAIRLRESNGAAESPEATMDRVSLVHTLRWLYELDDATALADETLSRSLTRFGPDHAVTLAARDARAGCLLDAQDFDRAEREYREALVGLGSLHGAGSREALAARGSLANLLSVRGDYAGAEAELRSVIRGWERHPGVLDAITARINLATVLAEQGKLGLALEMLTTADSEGTRVLGPDHPTLVTARSNAIEYLRRSGRETEALERSTSLLESLRSTFGPAHDLTLTQVVGQVAALTRAGRAAEAVATAHAAREACLAGLPATSSWHARMDASLAASLGAANRFPESLDMHRSAIGRLEAQLGPDHRHTLVARNNFGVAQIDSGEAAAAVETLQDVLVRVKATGYEEMLTAVLRNLGRAQCAAGASDAGVAMLEEAYRLSLERQEAQNAVVCAGLLADHFEREGQTEASGLWRARARAHSD